MELSLLLAKKNEATYGKKVTSCKTDGLAFTAAAKSQEVSHAGQTLGNPMLNFLSMN